MKLKILTLVCLPLLLASCLSVLRTEGLDVSLVNVRFTQATIFETTGEFTVRIQNSTPDVLRVEGTTHKIYVNGAYIGRGASGEALEVPRFGAATTTVTVYLRNLSLAARIKPIIEGREFDYRLNSVLYSVVGNSRRRLGAANEGRLDLRDFQPGPPAVTR